jgi:hypothetical protein
MTNATWESLANANHYSLLNTGVAYNTSTATTDISPGGNNAGQAFTFPGAYLQTGQYFRVRAIGIISNTSTPTLNLGVYWGGVATTALCTTGTVTTVSSLSNSFWKLETDIRVVTPGTNGNVLAVGSVGGIYAATTYMPASSSSGNLVTLNTSPASILTIGAAWGTNSVSNSIQVTMFTVERLNEGSS